MSAIVNNSLHERALLVSLNISVWTARRYDAKATARLIRDFNAADDSGRFNKLLVSMSSIKAYQRAANEIRSFHYANTLPWTDEGQRILSAEHFFTYKEKMRELTAAFESAVNDFIAEYPALIEQAKFSLGDLFNGHDYPAAAAIRGKFGISIKESALPAARDFRVNLGADEVQRIQSALQDNLSGAVESAIRDIWARLHEAVAHMVEKLKDKDAIFRDSLIGNIRELAEVMPRLNITDSPELAAAIRDIQESLCPLEPEELREDKKARNAAAKKADEILRKLGEHI